MLNLNIVNPQLWITTSTSSKVAPGQKVCHPTLRCHNLSTRVFWVLQVTNLFVAAQRLIRFLAVNIVVDFWAHFFWIQQGLDDQDFAQVTHATETCVTTPCTASIAITSPLPRKKSSMDSIETPNFKHFSNKAFHYFAKPQGVQQDSHFQISQRFSISDFNSWALQRCSCSLDKWRSRESLKKAAASKTHWTNNIKIGRTKTGIQGVLGAFTSHFSISCFNCLIYMHTNHFKHIQY